MSQTRFINPQALGKPPGYTHVVEVTAPARIVYIAGQLGVDRDGRVAGDIRAQAVQAFENLKAALAAIDGDFGHVVKLNNYLVDRAHLPIFREVRDSYLPPRQPAGEHDHRDLGFRPGGSAHRDRGGRDAPRSRTIEGEVAVRFEAREQGARSAPG
jgi:enamine deaminase RidA (YjgF/YER057c/UK114 family)